MDIATWLRELGLERYEPTFRDHEITAEILPELTDADLRELGLPLGPRKILLKAIAALCAGERAAASEATLAATPRGQEAERRQLTVLFCDLVGSTELAAQLDPEDMGAVVRGYHGVCTDVIRRWDGHVAKYLGDGVLAYFGWPRAHEDDVERAVRAGLELVEAVCRLEAPQNTALQARVGIATGLVMVGELIGEGVAQEQAVVGETPNLAARLQAVAAPESVVVAAETRRLLSGLFEFEELGRHALKGFKEVVRAFRVVGEGSAESRFEAIHGGRLAPLVGREHELGLLLDRWERAKEGEGQVVLLCGEPGIGKSRIVRALRERLEGESYMPLSHFCSPHHVNSALHPVISLLERAAGFERTDTAEQRLEKLEALLALGTDKLDRIAPLIASMLGVAAHDRYPPLDLSPQQQKQRTLEALADQVEGLARRQPVLAIYEDAHWMDPTTLEALDLVVQRVQRHRVLVVITFRPEFVPPWSGHPHVAALTLSRLSRREGAAVVERLTGGKACPEEVLEQILTRTDGVPLFVEELTKVVLESGLLIDAGDRYELAGPLPPLAIPSSLHDSLMARLDRLAPVKEIAQIGAAIGRDFPYELLAVVASIDQAKLLDALTQLVGAELIFRRGTPPEATYSFKHALVRDAAYQSLLKSRRQQIHASIARALHTRFAGAVDSQPEVPAYHFTEAGLIEEAIPYWERAASRASARSAYREAIAHASKGLELIRSLPRSRQRAAQELTMLLVLGNAVVTAKGWTSRDAEEVYLRARELADEIDDVAQRFAATWNLWLIYQQRAQIGPARRFVGEVMALAEADGSTDFRLQAHHGSWTTLFCCGDLASVWPHIEKGLALYDFEAHRSHAFRYGGHDPGMCARGHAALTLWHLGYAEQALDKGGEALALAERLAHPLSMIVAHFLTAILHQFRAEPPRVRERVEAAIAMCNEHGFPHYVAPVRILRGWASAAEGEVAEGLAEMEDGLAAMAAATYALRRPYYLYLLAQGCLWAGRPDEGIGAVDDAFEQMRTTDERRWEPELHRLKGDLLLALPRSERAEVEDCYRRSLKMTGQQQDKMWELRSAVSLARLWAEQGRRTEAYDLLSPVYGWFTEGFETADLAEARALLDQVR